MGVFRRRDRRGSLWVAEKQHRGLRVRSACFHEKWRAEEVHAAMCRAVRNGTFLEDYGPHSIGTVAELADEYLHYCKYEKEKPNASSTLGDKEHHLHVIGQLLDQRVDKITKFAVQRLKKELLTGKLAKRVSKRCGPTTNRYLATLSDFYSWLEDAGRVQGNPVRRIRRFSENTDGWSAPTEAEFNLMLAHADDQELHYLPALLVTLYDSGMRIAAECLQMRREHLDFGWKGGRGLIKTPAAKRGKRGGLAMTARLRSVLLEHVANLPKPCMWVFPNRAGDGPLNYDRAYRGFVRTLKRAGLTGFRPHDLRHGFATRLGAAGATEAEIQNYLRQRTGWMTQRYVHLGEEHTAKAAQRLDSATQSATHGDDADVVQIAQRSQNADTKWVTKYAGVAELADAADLKSADLGHLGSSPSPGTCLESVICGT